MPVKQISAFVENKAGALLDITSHLHNCGINIRAVTLADTTRFGIIRLIVDNPLDCERTLKNEGFTVSISNVLVVGLRDEPGGLSEAVSTLSNNGICIDYIYAFISHSLSDACVIMRTPDIELAERILSDAGFKLYSDSDLHLFS